MQDETFEEYYERDFPYRGRGLQDLDDKVGGVDTEIQAFLRSHSRMSILEVGCGFGTALLQLAARYGDRVALHGLNRIPRDGDRQMLQYNSRRLGLTCNTASAIALVHADASDGLPFPSATMDLVFSQLTWLFISDKLKALQEVARVLSNEGVGKVQFWFKPARNPPECGALIELDECGDRVSALSFVAKSEGLELKWTEKSAYAIVRSNLCFSRPFRLIEATNLQTKCADHLGIKSVYSLVT